MRVSSRCREQVSLRKFRTWAPKAPNDCQDSKQKGTRAAWHLPPKGTYMYTCTLPYLLQGNEGNIVVIMLYSMFVIMS